VLREKKDGVTQAVVPIQRSWRFAYLTAVRSLLGWEAVRALTNPIYFEKGS